MAEAVLLAREAQLNTLIERMYVGLVPRRIARLAAAHLAGWGHSATSPAAADAIGAPRPRLAHHHLLFIDRIGEALNRHQRARAHQRPQRG